MQATKIISIIVLSAVFGVTAGHAQSLRDAQLPAEFPPGSYSGKQYVDSRGCVYVRAGYGDAVTWVPRVARNRQVVCGYKPTLAGVASVLPVIKDPPTTQAVVVAVTAPKITPEMPSEVAIAPLTPVTPDPPVVAITPAPVQTTVTATRIPWWRRTPSPAPTVAVSTEAVAVAASPVTEVPATAPVRRVRSLSEACPNASVISKRYIGSGNRYAVRCGPQPVHPGIYGVGPAQMSTPTSIAGGTSRLGTSGAGYILAAPVQIPDGYKTAWQDGRLNPQRAQGTAQGEAQMALVWTNTVPRKLVEVRVSTNLSTRSAVAPQRARSTPVVKARATVAAATPVPTTRTALATTTASSFRYVQVGTFGVAANAQATAARLAALGLPVRFFNVTSKGRALKIVLAGPFTAQAQLSQALAVARRAGFKDAFYRR